MSFAFSTCTNEQFEKLALPENLKSNEGRNPITNKCCFDVNEQCVLIFHPMSHADYPDSYMSFFVDGKHHSVEWLCQRSDGPDRIRIRLARLAEPERNRVLSLLKQAFAVVPNEAIRSLPIGER